MQLFSLVLVLEGVSFLKLENRRSYW